MGVQGLGFKVQYLRFRVEVSGFRVQGLLFNSGFPDLGGLNVRVRGTVSGGVQYLTNFSAHDTPKDECKRSGRQGAEGRSTVFLVATHIYAILIDVFANF